MTRLYDELVFDDIDIFLLFEIDYDFITVAEFIEECKHIIVISFCPWKIGAMSEYETISILSWIGRSWVFHYALFEFSHKYLVPFI